MEITLWSDAQKLSDIRKSIFKDLNESEWGVLVEIGKQTGLNPYLREIFAVKRYQNDPAQIMIGRDGYRKSAQRSPEYDYHFTGAIYENDTIDLVNGEVKHQPKFVNQGKLVAAYFVGKRKGASQPITHIVRFEEYYQGNKNPDGTVKMKRSKNYHGQWEEKEMGPTTWDTKPETMIKKVAESQGLRMLFQEIFAGTYAEEEFDQFEPQIAVVESEADPALETLRKLVDGLENKADYKAKKKELSAAIDACKDQGVAKQIVVDKFQSLTDAKTQVEVAKEVFNEKKDGKN